MGSSEYVQLRYYRSHHLLQMFALPWLVCLEYLELNGPVVFFGKGRARNLDSIAVNNAIK